MNSQLFVIILVVHYLADFALQTQEQAERKSFDNEALTQHAGNYATVWLLISYGLLGTWYKPLIFACITFICHFMTDMYTSKVVKKYFEKKDWHNGFVVIGADQVLHYVQLLITFAILI